MVNQLTKSRVRTESQEFIDGLGRVDSGWVFSPEESYDKFLPKIGYNLLSARDWAYAIINNATFNSSRFGKETIVSEKIHRRFGENALDIVSASGGYFTFELVFPSERLIPFRKSLVREMEEEDYTIGSDLFTFLFKDVSEDFYQFLVRQGIHGIWPGFLRGFIDFVGSETSLSPHNTRLVKLRLSNYLGSIRLDDRLDIKSVPTYSPDYSLPFSAINLTNKKD